MRTRRRINRPTIKIQIRTNTNQTLDEILSKALKQFKVGEVGTLLGEEALRKYPVKLHLK